MEKAHFPSRTAVYTFTADEVRARLQPAAQPLSDHYVAELKARKVLG